MLTMTKDQYWRHRLFKGWWSTQLELDKIDRFKPLRFQRTVFTTYAKTIRKSSLKMPRKKEQKAPKFEWKGYVNIGITEADVPALEKFVSDEKTVFALYTEMLTLNYQIKLFFDDYTESIKCVAVCHQHDDPNFGYALTAFADNWYNAIAVMIYKHVNLCEKDWDNASSVTLRKFG